MMAIRDWSLMALAVAVRRKSTSTRTHWSTARDLDINEHGLTLWDLERQFATGGFDGSAVAVVEPVEADEQVVKQGAFIAGHGVQRMARVLAGWLGSLSV